jgi:hypothetical protein
MAYMIYQQYTTAIREAYLGRQDAAAQQAKAQSFREWLEELEINPAIRDGLVEQARVLEDAFADCSRTPAN